MWIKRVILFLVLTESVMANFIQEIAPIFNAFTNLENIAFLEQNHIQADSNLFGFYDKLKELKAKKRAKVRVLQIGDSHLQADFESQEIRSFFQDEFGEGGRGLVIPYKLAKSNEPWTTRSELLAGKTKSARLVLNYDDVNYGLSALRIFKESDSLIFKLGTRGLGHYSYQFDEIYFPNSKTFKCPQIQSDSLIWSLKSDSIFCRYHSDFGKKAMVQVLSSDSLFYFDEAMVQNQDTGVIWSVLAHNGTEFAHLARNIEIFEDPLLSEFDLIIMNLGTNDAIARRFDASLVEKNMEAVVQKIKNQNPNAAILLTTPIDFKWNGRSSVYLPKVAEKIRRVAQNENCALWDLYQISGEEGSRIFWTKNHFMQKDGVHMTQSGYKTKGQLFNHAFISSWNHYVFP